MRFFQQSNIFHWINIFRKTKTVHWTERVHGNILPLHRYNWHLPWTEPMEVFMWSGVGVGAEDRHGKKVMLTQAKKRKRMDRQLKNETGNWRRTNKRLSEPMNDSFTDDLWMIYPWTCFCLSKHQRPLPSEDAVCGEKAGASAHLSLLKRWPSGRRAFPRYQSFCPPECTHFSPEHFIQVSFLLHFQKVQHKTKSSVIWPTLTTVSCSLRSGCRPKAAQALTLTSSCVWYSPYFLCSSS